MKLTPEGLALIKSFEGCKLKAYQDIVGVWTIGYGHTGPDVRPGMEITQAEADELLAKDLLKFEIGVKEVLPGVMSDNMFSACVSLAYNIGLEAFRKSLLVRCCQAYNFDHAAGEFLKWDKAAGRTILGLTRRRQAEKKLFLTPCS